MSHEEDQPVRPVDEPGSDGFGDDHSPKRHVLANSLSSYLRDGLEVVVFLVITPFIVDTIGMDHFGLWQLVWSVVSLFTLIDMGFGPSVGKFVADARGKRDPAAHQRSVGTLFWIYVIQALLLGIIVAGCAALSNVVFRVSEGTLARHTLLILGGGMALGLPLSMFNGVLLGHQKLRIANLFTILGSLGYFGITLALLPRFPDIRVLAAFNTGAITLAALAQFFYVQRTLPHASVHPRHFRSDEVRTLWGFSFYYMLITVAGLIAMRVDTLIIQWALDLRDIAIYSLALRLMWRVTTVGVQIQRTLAPVIAELYGAGRRQEVHDLWISGSKLSTAFSAPLVGGLFILARPLIITWMSEDFEESILVLRILLMATMVIVVHNVSHAMLAMRDQQKRLAMASIGGQAVNLVLSAVIVWFYGLPGVAAATVVSVMLTNVAVILGWVTWHQGISRLHFYRRTLLPAVVPLAVMAGFLWALRRVYVLDHLADVAVAEFLAVLTFWGVYWFIGLNRGERRWVSDRIRARLGRFRRTEHH